MAGRRSRLAVAAPVWLALALPAGAQTTFSDATTTAGLSSSEHRLGSSWGDFDGDGLPDVLIGSHFYAPPTLYRNRGIATAGMAAVVDIVRREIAPVVSLYVNDWNDPARAVYEKVGFEETARFATVMF